MITIQEYLAKIVSAIRNNNPVMWPAYDEQGPELIWRYIARNIGHGLGVYSQSEVKTEIGALYGQIVVIAEFGTRRGVTINASTFVGWILEARQEALPRS